MNIWMDVDTALSEVPVNIAALIDDTDFKAREESIVYNQAGMDLVWNFVTTAGVMTQTVVTPTTAGVYDWVNQGNGMYSIEIPASGGVSINNDTEGFGWFTGFATGILPWRGPVIGLRAAVLNNALIDGGDLLDVNITHIADTSQTAGDIAALINALNDLTATETGAAVWNALLASYNLANSFGERINNIGSAADMSDAVWDESKTGHVAVGTFGEEVQAHSLSTELSTHDGKLDIVDGIVDNILIDTGTTLPAEHAALPTSAEITDAVWDELLTAGTHNVTTSAGRRLRDIASDIVLTGTSPNTAGTANTLIRIEFDGDASSVDGTYDPAVVIITGGTGIGQSRQIFEYDGTNKYAYINRTWKVIPDNTSTYTIVGHSGDTHVNEGLVTGGSSTTITLNALASSIDDTYIGQLIFLAAGTGEDQSRMIIDYNGTTKVATLDRAWETNPVNGATVYLILPATDLTVTTDKIDVIDAIVDAILLDTGTDGVVVATGSKTGYALSAAGIEANWDEVIEGALTARHFLRVVLAAVAGITTDGGLKFRDNADAKNRIVAVTDSSKNRTSITLDGSD